MVMDQNAWPLTRSWCLFEVFQTCLLTMQRDREDFIGSLWVGRQRREVSAHDASGCGGRRDCARALARKWRAGATRASHRRYSGRLAAGARMRDVRRAARVASARSARRAGGMGESSFRRPVAPHDKRASA